MENPNDNNFERLKTLFETTPSDQSLVNNYRSELSRRLGDVIANEIITNRLPVEIYLNNEFVDARELIEQENLLSLGDKGGWSLDFSGKSIIDEDDTNKLKPVFSRLSYLNMEGTEYEDKSLLMKILSCPMPQLRRLFLGGINGVGDEEVCYIANNSSYSNLEVLLLWATRLEDEGLCAIAKSQYLSKLKFLDLSGCYLGHFGINALAESSALPSLEKLYIGWQKDDQRRNDSPFVEAILNLVESSWMSRECRRSLLSCLVSGQADYDDLDF